MLKEHACPGTAAALRTAAQRIGEKKGHWASRYREKNILDTKNFKGL